MKLYYMKGSCSLVVRIIINELELESQFESVDLKTKKTETGKDFLMINPKGSVPVIELNHGEVLTEGAVILQYLADHAKAFTLLPQVGDMNRYRILEWVNYIATELHKGLGIFFNPSITEELQHQVFIPLLKPKFNYLNNCLQHHEYLAGDQFTLPDAYLFVILRWASHFKIELTEWNNLIRYFITLTNRKSIQQSLMQEGL